MTSVYPTRKQFANYRTVRRGGLCPACKWGNLTRPVYLTKDERIEAGCGALEVMACDECGRREFTHWDRLYPLGGRMPAEELAVWQVEWHRRLKAGLVKY